MALVRVYCGLASADETVRTAGPAVSPLTIAVVDDGGRLLGVHEIGDDPAGYAQLGSLLVERTSGFTEAAVAADSDDHLVTSLLTAAGRPLIVADDDATDDFAERFADDDSVEEMQAPPAARRAVGLARALQAGALTAVTLPSPRELVSYQPVLAAHVAMLTGRHAAAGALREVLRELYPAALRAYPDPAHPLALAVLDAVPEPGRLTGRGADVEQVAEQVVAELTRAGTGTEDQVTAAVTALLVAISESPRRGGVNKSLAPAAADAVRHAISAVRSCGSACESMIGTLAARFSAQAATAGVGRRTAGARRAGDTAPVTRVAEPRPDSTTRLGRRGRPEPAASGSAPVTPRALTTPPVAPAPTMPPPLAPRPVTPPPVAPAASLTPRTADLPNRSPGDLPGRASGRSGALAGRATDLGDSDDRPGYSSGPDTSGDRAGRSVSESPGRPGDVPGRFGALPGRPVTAGPGNRPVSVPPPPPGMTPIVPGTRPAAPVSPADTGQPFRPTLTNAAMTSARAERQRTVIPPRPSTRNGATEYPVQMPAQRPDAAVRPATAAPADRDAPVAEPGSRANWPLLNSGDDTAAPPAAASDGRVRPPWQDMPKEPPALRLVEPSPLDSTSGRAPAASEPPALRLVDDRNGRSVARTAARRNAITALDRSTNPPVPAEGDGDLLIFAAARSAWFTGHDDGADERDWRNPNDTGWRAAEKAATPEVAAETSAGLPRRVPQANLVPGAPLREESPLKIVRDAASIAAHTTGYFRGWRRGQEIGGYAIGGRPGRESAGGWDFSRDGQPEDRNNAEYHSN